MQKSTHSAQYALLRQRLAAIRKEAGLSQRQLAVVLRVPHSWVAKVESGERRIDLVEFGWFCAACDAAPENEAAGILSAFTRRSRPQRGRRS